MRYDSELQAMIDDDGAIVVASVSPDVGEEIDGWRKSMNGYYALYQETLLALTDAQAYNATLVNDLAAAQKQVNLLADKLQAGAYYDKDTALLLDQQAKRIKELEAQLAAVLATVDAATSHDGRTYAEDANHERRSHRADCGPKRQDRCLRAYLLP